MEDRKTVRDHCLMLENRRNLRITGVQEVGSFNENEIMLLTEEGKLLIKGEQIHVKGLNLEQGEASVEGKINSLCYVSKSSTDRNDTLLKRLLR